MKTLPRLCCVRVRIIAGSCRNWICCDPELCTRLFGFVYTVHCTVYSVQLILQLPVIGTRKYISKYGSEADQVPDSRKLQPNSCYRSTFFIVSEM